MAKSVIKNKSEFNVDLAKIPNIPLPKNVLMVSPTYFNIDTPINAHMVDKQGNKHLLNKEKAMNQWNKLKHVYEGLGFSVFVQQGMPNLPDMVFCANQSFPYLSPTQATAAIMSNMFNNTRHKEVDHIKQFLMRQKYSTQQIETRSEKTYFEGMGDVAWLGNKKFLLGGYGFRTSPEIYDKLSQITQCPVAIFELKNPKFYHLDTCLSILNSTTALVCKEAFTPEGFELLESLIPNLLHVPLAEADAPGFACNAHCPDEKSVIIQAGNKTSNKLIEKHGFAPIEVDTSEFIKSGGSVYCMKLMFF